MENLKYIVKILEKENLKYAVLGNEQEETLILLSPDDEVNLLKISKQEKWINTDNKIKQKCLYGMHEYLYFSFNNYRFAFCFQLGCKSTLNNAWVPLDRCINIGALDRVLRKDGKNYYQLSNEDYLCYLLAKSVYTDKEFKKETIALIDELVKDINIEAFMKKLSFVFFKFTDEMTRLVQAGKYTNIISDFWQFAEY